MVIWETSDLMYKVHGLKCEIILIQVLILYLINHLCNIQEQYNYISFCVQTETQIKEAEEKITECKNEVRRAKQVRKHRQGTWYFKMFWYVSTSMYRHIMLLGSFDMGNLSVNHNAFVSTLNKDIFCEDTWLRNWLFDFYITWSI